MDRYALLRSIYVGLYKASGASIKKMSQAIAEFGITPAQLGVLVNIPAHGATMTELIRKVGCAPSNMTSLVARMERDGFVMTGRNPDDQRETLVHLSATGIELLEKARPAHAHFLEESYGHLSTAEQMMLSELLGKLHANLSG